MLVTEGDDFSSDYITIIGDDTVAFKSEEMNKTSKPIDIEVDVTGVNDFKIIFATHANIRIANAGFYQ